MYLTITLWYPTVAKWNSSCLGFRLDPRVWKLKTEAQMELSLSRLPHGERWVTPWTTTIWHRDRQPFTSNPANSCLWTVGRSQSSHTSPQKKAPSHGGVKLRTLLLWGNDCAATMSLSRRQWMENMFQNRCLFSLCLHFLLLSYCFRAPSFQPIMTLWSRAVTHSCHNTKQLRTKKAEQKAEQEIALC